MPLTEWDISRDGGTGVFTASTDGPPRLSFSAFSAVDAVSAGRSFLRGAASSFSSGATSKRSERSTLSDESNKRIKSLDEDDDARTGDDEDDYEEEDVDAFLACLEKAKEECLRYTSSTNAIAPPSDEGTRRNITPPTEYSTEDAEATSGTSVSRVSVGWPKTYRMDENGSWINSIRIHYKATSKEILDEAVDHVKSVLPDNPSANTDEDGIDNVTSITLLKEKGHIPTLMNAFLPSLMALIFTANFGWSSFTTQVLEDLVAASKTADSGYESTIGVCYMKVYHRTKQWWMGKIRRCVQYCTNRFVLTWAANVRGSLTNLDDNAYFTALYFGESMLTFRQRMAFHYPIHFYEWFGPWTYSFVISRTKKNVQKQYVKCAVYVSEGLIACLMKSLLTEYSIHSMNDAPCGKRFGIATANYFRMYAIIEILADGVQKVLTVVSNWMEVRQRLGKHYLKQEGVQNDRLEVGVPFALPLLRNMFVVKLMDRADISNYMQAWSDGGIDEGIDRLYQAKRVLLLRNATFGVMVSNGLTDQDGGTEGTDYCMFSAFRDAINSDWIQRLGTKPFAINDVIGAMKNNQQGLFVNSPKRSAHGRMMNDRDIVIYPGYSVRKPGCFISLSLLMYSRFSGEFEKEVYQITLDDIIMNKSTDKWEIKLDENIVNKDESE
jgi:hypothetical protein